MAFPSRAWGLRIPVLAGAAAIALAIAVFADTPALAETTPTACSLYASPAGSDSAPGTLEHPFATIQHLASSLAAGQVGCARGGTYTQEVSVSHGGSSGAPLTITSYPGERATLVGRLYLREGANFVTISNMNLNGKNSSSLPSPTINDTNATFLGDDITNEHTEICFTIGSSWGRAKQTVIQRNRIHDCGLLPSRNQDHGIYVAQADNTQILENVIFNNTDRGIQLYPNAQGTSIERNIITANGEGIIFSGSNGTASSNTTVKDNLITNAVLRYDVESWYPSGNPIGQGNTVQSNCIWGGAYGTIQPSETGFTATLNLTANPEYANPATGDYRVNTTSPCAALLTGSTIPTQPFNTTETTTTAVTAVSMAAAQVPRALTASARPQPKPHHRARHARRRRHRKHHRHHRPADRHRQAGRHHRTAGRHRQAGRHRRAARHDRARRPAQRRR